tara:strand:- start:306 stop:767 length:462 start_codon:yes stop_codon:yes gene_type:complete
MPRLAWKGCGENWKGISLYRLLLSGTSTCKSKRKEFTMTTVLEDLKRRYKLSLAEAGPDDVVTKMLKAQIAAARAPGKTAADLWISGPLQRPAKPAAERRASLEASKPQRQAFASEEEFEEALGYWMGHVGRILALTKPSPDSPPPSPSMGDE